jgi:hypothetical protein
MGSRILKYDPLEEQLRSTRASRGSLVLSFSEIETIIGVQLPSSAYLYREWWSNQSDVSNRPQGKAWISAGYEVECVQQERNNGTVRFNRRYD